MRWRERGGRHGHPRGFAFQLSVCGAADLYPAFHGSSQSPALLQEAAVEADSRGQPLAALPARLHPWRLALKVAGSAAILAVPPGWCGKQTRVLESERLYQPRRTGKDHNDLEGSENAFQRSVDRNDLNGKATLA